MKTFKMSAEWTVYSEVEVKAESYEKAIEIMENVDLSELPTEYVEDSFSHNIQMNLVLNQDDKEALTEIEKYHGQKL